MRTFSRVGMVPVAFMLAAGTPAALLAQPADRGESAPAPIDPSTLPLRDLRTDTDITLESLRGRIVAVHFLGGGERDLHDGFIHEFLEQAPTVAGVRHVFLHSASSADARAWLESLDALGLDAQIVMDADAALRRTLGVDGPESSTSTDQRDPASLVPATVVLESDGRELFRLVGAHQHEHPDFATFAARVRETTRTAAIDQYNLPRVARNATCPLAVEGYDVVSYFNATRPARGQERHTSEYRGVEYRFVSEANLRLFASDPEAFLPTYGGWCASAMGDGGRKVEVSPTNYQVRQGRLYLFYKDIFSDALADWKRHPEWEAQADRAWRRIAAEEPRLPK